MADFLKAYEPVEDRIRAFWSDHPEGRIITELVHVDEVGGYVVKASVWRHTYVSDHRPQELPDATGLAEEHMTEGHRVNQTWPLENCETSAIGRALANLGYAAKGKRPSREEMSKASPAAGPPAESRRMAPQDGVATKGEGTRHPDRRDAGPGTAPSPAGDSSSVSGGTGPRDDGGEKPATSPGEADAGTAGEETSSASPAPTFPVDPRNCNHKSQAGHWLPTKTFDGVARCIRCGESALIYRETA